MSPVGFTLSHAAPETVRYDGAIDERTDVYGLGSTLYTALTGRPPIPARPGEEDAARAARVLGEQPLRPEGPEQLVDLLLAMLAKDPSDRPAMTVVADTLAGAAGPTPAAPPVPPSPGRISGGSPFAPVPPPPARVPVFAPPPDLRPAFPRPLHPCTTTPADGPPRERMALHRPRPCRRRVDPVAGRDTGARPLPGRSGRRTAPGAARNRRGGRRRRLRARRLVPAPGCGTCIPCPRPPRRPRPDRSGHRARIQLDAPVDRGESVELSWSSDASLDYAVEIGEPGAQPKAQLVGRVTTVTLPVTAGQKYCFRIQGSNPAGTVSESNVVSLRDAVCRFEA